MEKQLFKETIDKTSIVIEKAIEKGIKSVCLCGSSKFCDLIAVIKWEFEKKGIIATGLNFLPEWYTNNKQFVEPHHLAEQENVADILDSLHETKIDNSDCIIVVNPNNYIGERTAIEIKYANDNITPVYYWETKD